MSGNRRAPITPSDGRLGSLPLGPDEMIGEITRQWVMECKRARREKHKRGREAKGEKGSAMGKCYWDGWVFGLIGELRDDIGMDI